MIIAQFAALLNQSKKQRVRAARVPTGNMLLEELAAAAWVAADILVIHIHTHQDVNNLQYKHYYIHCQQMVSKRIYYYFVR